MIFYSDILEYTFKNATIQNMFDTINKSYPELNKVKLIIANSNSFQLLQGTDEDAGSYILKANYEKENIDFIKGIAKLGALLIYDLRHGAGSLSSVNLDSDKDNELTAIYSDFISASNLGIY